MEIKKSFYIKTAKIGILQIVSICITAVLNISIILALVLAKNYYDLALSASIFLIISIILLLVIIDIIAYVGFRFNDLKLNIINIACSILLSVVSIIVCVYLGSINSSIDKIIENTGTEQYETISITLACYKDDYSQLSDCSGKKIGILSESEVGTASIFKEKAQKENLTLNYSEYNTTSDLFFALITDEIDIGVFPSNYRMLYKDDDESDFSDYLNDVKDFYLFEEKVKTGENSLANADLTLEPFNVLLIGFAPEEGSNGKYGLADSIIVATINPQTLEVGLTSIARDSYVPISCYSGYKDKINAARGKSRQCLMDTVGELLDLNIDLYMEANFKAVVEIVDAVGGIDINSPVAFTGQTSSEIRGTYTIQIPKGYYHANGEEALAYARERHTMPAGDFDRQEHQKEVIARVVEKILEAKNINTITNIIKACGDNLSTNISLNQIKQFFNHVISIKNYTTLSLPALVDMQNARLTGYSSWYYNYSAQLPLWIYKLYDGSIEEAKQHINNIMIGHRYVYKENDCAKFFSYYPYERPKFYHTVFNEAQEDEKMPAFYKTLTKMSYSEVMEWASANGVSVNVEMILPGDSRYDESRVGQVLSQSVPYGSLVSDYPSVTITVMGEAKGTSNLPSGSLSTITSWCNEHGISYNVIWENNPGNVTGGTVISTNPPAGTLSTKVSSVEIHVYKYLQINVDSLQTYVGQKLADVSGAISGAGYTYTTDNSTMTNVEADDNKIISITSTNPETSPSQVIIKVYKYEQGEPTPTCPKGGTYPNCTCDEGETYNSGTNSCDLPTPPPPTCPKGGTYPNCTCDEGETYNSGINSCDITPVE